MRSINKVCLLGYVGQDPLVKTTSNGMVVATLSLATTDRIKDANGDYSDRTEWHNLVVFGKTAQVVGDYVRKGSRILVEGKLRTRTWNDKNTGEKKYRTEVTVYELILLDSAEHRGEHAPTNEYAGGTAAEHINPEITDDDIPF